MRVEVINGQTCILLEEIPEENPGPRLNAHGKEAFHSPFRVLSGRRLPEEKIE